MTRYACVDADGSCQGVLLLSDEAAAAHPLPAMARLVGVSDEAALALQAAGPWAYLRDGEWRLRTEASARRADLRAGLTGAGLVESAARRMSIRGTLGLPEDLEDLPDLTAPTRRVPFDPVSLRPGLEIRLMNEREAARAGQAVVESGLYSETAAVIQATAEGWWWDPACWPLMVMWRGAPLEFEWVFFESPERAHFGFTWHVDHERPHWFWRECERPVFEALQRAGIRTFWSAVRGDRRPWIEVLKRTYGAVEAGTQPGGFVRLEYDVAVALAAARGWPARRSAGPDWQWSEGSLALKQADAADLPAADQALAEAWGGRRRGLLVRRMLTDRWELDQAAILLGFSAGQIVDVFVIRERTEILANVATLAPWRLDEPSQGTLRRVATEWQQLVGYLETSSFTPEWMWQHPQYAKHFARIGGHVVARHAGWDEPWIELRASVAELLARPRRVWETT